MNARVWLAGLLMAVLPSIVMAQGRIAVVNLEQAILQTDVAQQRLEGFESNEDFASDKSQFDALRAELDQLVKDFQRDQAAMSEEDQVAAIAANDGIGALAGMDRIILTATID